MECSDEYSIDLQSTFSFKGVVVRVKQKGWVKSKVGRNWDSEISKSSSPPRPRLKLTGVLCTRRSGGHGPLTD